MRLHWLAVLALLVAVAPSSTAWSAGGQRVALVGTPADAPLTRQLRVELAGLGFEAVVLENSTDLDAAGEALQLMRIENVVAIIRTWPDKARVEVWVSDADTGALSTRGMNPTRSDATPRVIALRAIELLRASLRELEAKRLAAAEPSPSPAGSIYTPADVAPPPSASVEGPRPPRWVAGVGGAVLASPGGMGPAFGIEPSLQVWPLESWGFSALAIVPLSDPRISKQEGSASVGIFMAGLGPSWRLRLPRAWQIEGSLGGGAALLRTTGSASAPYEGQADIATAATAYGTMSAKYRVAPELAVGAGILFGSLFSPAEIKFAGHPAANWGVPYGAATIGMSVRIY